MADRDDNDAVNKGDNRKDEGLETDAEALRAELTGENREDSGDEPRIGEATLDESGLSLNLEGDEADEEPIEDPVTRTDLANLSMAEAQLEQRWPETKIDPSLERIEMLMDLLGSPQRAYPTIHVAGTNGKTSVVRMVESLLRAFHRRTGRTTSPHLQLITERIAIDGKPIHPRVFAETWQDIKPYVEMVDEKTGIPMSEFEVLTAIAYAAFADAPVDVGVVEVGLGGRWDATNVIDSDVAVITPVGLDHRDYLGDTIAEIAGEKAGIIKPRRTDDEDVIAPKENIAIVAEQDPEAMPVILQRAVDTETAVARAGVEFGVVESRVAVGGQMLTINGLSGRYEDIMLPLSGEHQARNAATALAAVEAFFGAAPGHQLDQEAVRAGFAAVTSPGRLERVRSAPTTFIDAAHNPHGIKALSDALGRDFNFDRLIGVVGILSDKDADGILAILNERLDEVVITQNTSPCAIPAEELAERARDIFGDERVHEIDSLPTAIELAVELAEEADVQSGSGIIITGSVVTAGEARTLFGKEPA